MAFKDKTREREYKRQWRLNNLDRIKSDDKAEYEQNRERIKARVARHYRDNKEDRLAYAKAYRDKNRDDIVRKGRERRYAKFGGSVALFEQLVKSQNNLCAICGKSKKLGFDHCHTENTPRKLLCTTCNSGLGHFKDSIELLTKAIKYLQLQQEERKK